MRHSSTPPELDQENDPSTSDAETHLPVGVKLPRRKILGLLAGLGFGTLTWQRALAQQVENSGRVTAEMIQQAEWIADLELTEDQRKTTARTLSQSLRNFRALRKVEVGYDVPPATLFSAAPWQQPADGVRRHQAQLTESTPPKRPASRDRLAFLPVTELAALIKSRQVTSTELTQLYLERLRKYDPMLHCVVNSTEDLALQQAQRADEEIAAGHYRGPLHGIPWGAKDLIAYPGYKTTWGATPFKDRVLDEKATVARRLEEAGAVLVAKLSLGALAMGDRWFGKRTRNPWNPRQGSSGSSAGSASAVSAGLVGFALGTETLGSIVSPCRRCGTTGLRPTFGRVSRHGCMALSWTMDKVGPITRSVEDCALVLDAIHGHDGQDPTAVDQPFAWPAKRDLRRLRVGYFEGRTAAEDRADLKVLRQLGVQLIPIELPKGFPAFAVTLMLDTEASAVFDELTRQGITEGLNSWPETFRNGQFIPAVEYLRASRVRTLMMREMDELMRQVDLYVGGNDLVLTNLTGHPTVVMPNGFFERRGVRLPRSITFTGRLFGETDLLAVAQAYQQATGYHLEHPDLDSHLESQEDSKQGS